MPDVSILERHQRYGFTSTQDSMSRKHSLLGRLHLSKHSFYRVLFQMPTAILCASTKVTFVYGVCVCMCVSVCINRVYSFVNGKYRILCCIDDLLV